MTAYFICDELHSHDGLSRKDTRGARTSYSRLSRFPAFGLYDADGRLVATIRAETARVARDLFRAHGLSGARVRRVA